MRPEISSKKMQSLFDNDPESRYSVVMETVTAFPWSEQQTQIFSWFEVGSNHLVCRARAGTGKTTVIIEGVKRAPERSILICAFSKDIQLALLQKIGKDYPHVTAMTLHAVGYQAVRLYREKIKVEDFKAPPQRAKRLARQACGNKAPDAIIKLVAKLHTKGREIAPHAKSMGDLTAIAYTFECEPDEQFARMGFGIEYVEEKALAAMELASNVQEGDEIDGSDMIFLPVRNGWLHGQYDLVVVDEAQDMTNAQLEIAQGVLNKGGRICIVGDDKQAIFGFRGADSGSLDRLKNELMAAELGLTITYRCGKAIVNLAKTLVPDFQAGENNGPGEIHDLHIDKLVGMAGPGDFVLSRVNAPLVSIAIKLLRSGKRTRVAGQDIGRGLVALLSKLNARSVPELLGKIEAWVSRETSRLAVQAEKASDGRRDAIQAKIENVRDQAAMLIELADGARSATDVTDRIEALFVDDGLGKEGMITCSSVHRSKGLESRRVFILTDTLRDDNDEERNITYVAWTRAKETLVRVYEDKKARSADDHEDPWYMRDESEEA